MAEYRIMIVDDSRVVHQEMKKMLADTEIEVACCCRSGEEALEKYEEVAPDLVTMDIVMPGVDGLDTCEQILQRWPDACVYMVSSMAYSDMVDRAAAIGAKGFLFKPFNKDALLQSLRSAFKAANKTKEEC